MSQFSSASERKRVNSDLPMKQSASARYYSDVQRRAFAFAECQAKMATV